MKLSVKELVRIALMAALMCILGPFSIPVGPVPISLTVFFVFLDIYLLGTKSGTLSYVIYLLLGLAGLPVFTGFAGGAAKFFGPTGGYLIGGIFTCLISGIIIEHASGRWYLEAAGMLTGLILLYAFGSAWLAFQAHMRFYQALASGVIPFVMFDIMKLAAALILGRLIRVRIKNIGFERN